MSNDLHSSEESYDKHRILKNRSNKCKACKKDLATHNGYCFWCWEEIQEGNEMVYSS